MRREKKFIHSDLNWNYFMLVALESLCGKKAANVLLMGILGAS
jgi:hypothetical protein